MADEKPKKPQVVEFVEKKDVVRVLPDGRLSRADAAKYLGLQPNTLKNWKLEGIGPPWIVMGRRVFYPKDGLDAFIAKGRQAA